MSPLLRPWPRTLGACILAILAATSPTLADGGDDAEDEDAKVFEEDNDATDASGTTKAKVKVKAGKPADDDDEEAIEDEFDFGILDDNDGDDDAYEDYSEESDGY